MSMQNSNDGLCAKAARTYREEHINGLSQKELILMLYDGAIRYSSEAKEAIAGNNPAQTGRHLSRARSIIFELLRILDMGQGGEVAKNLQRLYVYMIERLIEADFKKDLRLLENVLAILENLRSAWAEIDFEAALSVHEHTANEQSNNTRLHNCTHQPPHSARLLSVTA